MSSRYFFKGLINQNPVRDRHGRGVQWEVINGNNGVIAIDDADLIADLDAIAGTRGVVSLTEERYQEVKKNSLSLKSTPRVTGPGPIHVQRADLSLRKKPDAPSVVAASVSVPAVTPPANTVLTGGDAKLAAAGVPPARPERTFARARPMRYEGQSVVHAPAAEPPAISFEPPQAEQVVPVTVSAPVQEKRRPGRPRKVAEQLAEAQPA